MRFAVFVAAAILLSGCGSNAVSPDDKSVETVSDAETVGAISGTVVDDERRPVPGIAVRLDPVSRTTETGPEGRFTFARVPVGVYELNVSAPAYLPVSLRVNVSEGQTETVLLTIIPRPSDVAHYETFPFSGIQRCMIYTSVYLGSCAQPYTAVYYTAHGRGVNLSQYGLPAEPIDNKYRTAFDVRDNYTGVVSELVWEAQSGFSDYYKLVLSCAWYDPVLDECVPPGETAPPRDGTYAVARGVSPLRIELWPRDVPKEYHPTIMARAYLSGPVEAQAGVSVDQRIDMYNSVFYGAPVPDRWSILVDG